MVQQLNQVGEGTGACGSENPPLEEPIYMTYIHTRWQPFHTRRYTLHMQIHQLATLRGAPLARCTSSPA